MTKQAVENKMEVQTLQVLRPAPIEFNITEDAIAIMEEQFMPLTIVEATDKAAYKVVEDAKRIVSKHRIDLEKRRKELKADALEYGRRVDSEAGKYSSRLEKIEAHLAAEKIRADEVLDKIKFEKAQKAKLDVRKARLKLIEMEVSEEELLTLDDLAFELKIASFTSEKLAKLKLAQEEAERASRAEQEAKEKALREEQEAKARVAQAEIEAQQKAIKEAQEKLEAEKRKFEAEIAAKKKAEEDAEKAKKDAEIKAAQEAELKKKLEAEAAERAKTLEEQKPDAEKLKAFAEKLAQFCRDNAPVVSTPWGKDQLKWSMFKVKEAIDSLNK